MSEKEIQNQILDYLAFLNIGFFWQNDSVGIKGRKRENRFRPNGVADIVGIVSGQFICIEVKSATGKLSSSQKLFKSRFTDCGGHYLMARSVDDIKVFLKTGGFI